MGILFPKYLLLLKRPRPRRTRHLTLPFSVFSSQSLVEGSSGVETVQKKIDQPLQIFSKVVTSS